MQLGFTAPAVAPSAATDTVCGSPRSPGHLLSAGRAARGITVTMTEVPGAGAAAGRAGALQGRGRGEDPSAAGDGTVGTPQGGACALKWAGADGPLAGMRADFAGPQSPVAAALLVNPGCSSRPCSPGGAGGCCGPLHG